MRFPLRGGPQGLVLALALLVLLGGCTPGQGQVGGLVRDADGAPVAGAAVWLGARVSHTDARGRYALTDVPPGRHAFVVLADGFQVYDATLEVEAGVQRVDVVLEPVPQARGGPSVPRPEPAPDPAQPAGAVRAPAFKLPLPGGYDWLLSVEPGGKFYGGEPDPGHRGRSYFSLDFIDNNRQQGELTGKRPVPVLAAADGTVVAVRNSVICQGCDFGYGNYVKLDHGGGFTTIYGHLRYPSVTVRLGERVRQGTVLGFMGSTGHSTGIHVHFEIRYLDQGAAQAAVLSQVLLEDLPLSAYKVGTVEHPRYYRSSQRWP